jgi:hypothetical protein
MLWSTRQWKEEEQGENGGIISDGLTGVWLEKCTSVYYIGWLSAVVCRTCLSVQLSVSDDSVSVFLSVCHCRASEPLVKLVVNSCISSLFVCLFVFS